jgi:hypothetical protein
MGYTQTCSTGGANTGLPKCRGDYGRDSFPIIVPRGAEIDTEANSLLLATWQGKFELDESTRWYALPKFFRYLPSREDHVYTQGDFNEKFSVREGYGDGVASYLNPAICFQKKLKEFNNQTWDFYWVTDKGYIRGWSQDGVILKPFSGFFHVEEEMPATADEGRLMQIRIYNTEAYQWEEYGEVINPIDDATATWDPRELEGLLDATCEVFGTPSGTEIVVDVQTYCDDTGISDLVYTDFVCEKAGVDYAISASAESSTVAGRYTLTVSTLLAEDYTVNLNEPAAMTTDGYQPGAADSFTIS